MFWAPPCSRASNILRRTLHALLQNFGPIGDVVDWIMAQAADVAALAWGALVESMQLLGRSIDEAARLRAGKSEQVLRMVVAAIEEAGMVVSRIIEWAVTAGDRALAIVGEVLVKAGNTVDSILLWVGPHRGRQVARDHQRHAFGRRRRRRLRGLDGGSRRSGHQGGRAN